VNVLTFRQLADASSRYGTLRSCARSAPGRGNRRASIIGGGVLGNRQGIPRLSGVSSGAH
jgi:hypothetical protein